MTNDTEQWLNDLEHDDTAEAQPAEDLRAIGEALIGIETAEKQLVAAVEHAHAAGRSWTEIGNVLGVSRQAARQRFATHVLA